MTEAEIREVEAAPRGLTVRNFKKHLTTITQHKLLVGKFCFQMGLYRQGLMHDLSKYMPTEFVNGVYYYLGFKSPIVSERLHKGRSDAWLHHKGRNKHHFEYWVDFTRDSDLPGGLTPLKMPRRYVAEMIADRVAASRTYHGKDYKPSDSLEFYNIGKDRIPLHPQTRKELEYFLKMVAVKGEDYTFRYIKEKYLRFGRQA